MLSHRAILWNSHRARHGLNRGCHTNRSIAMTRPKTLLEMAGAAGQPVLWDKSVLLLIDHQVEYTAAGGLPLTGIDAAAAEVGRLLAAARSHGTPGIHVRHHGRRSEERREGEECVRTCRSRWSPDK